MSARQGKFYKSYLQTTRKLFVVRTANSKSELSADMLVYKKQANSVLFAHSNDQRNKFQAGLKHHQSHIIILCHWKYVITYRYRTKFVSKQVFVNYIICFRDRCAVCRQYSELVYVNERPPSSGGGKKTLNCYNVLTLIVGGTKAKPKEFPHMVW